MTRGVAFVDQSESGSAFSEEFWTENDGVYVPWWSSKCGYLEAEHHAC